MNRARLAVVVVVLTAFFASSVSAAQAGDYIVVLKNGVNEPVAAADHAKKGAAIFQQYRHALNGYAATLSDSTLAAVQADPRVRFVAPDEEVHADAVSCGTPDRPPTQVAQCLPEGIDRIDGELSSTLSGDGSGSVNVNVAVLDTGIDLTHPDLNVVGGTNCRTGSNKKDFQDPNGHGTHVAGTIGARDNAFGVVGVAPGARLWAVRVLSKSGFGNISNVICGIDFVTATRTDSDPTNDIRVANMSLGDRGADDGNCGLTKKDPLHLAICRSVQAGVTYAVSAGNDAVDLQGQLPAFYDEVLTATAMTDSDGQPGGLGVPTTCSSGPDEVDDVAATFSNFATLASDRAHTISAPGVCVTSTYTTSRCSSIERTPPCYAIISGTSMASPHVAGTVALCIYSGPCAGLTPPQIVQKIVADAQAYNLANPGYGFLGDPLRPITGKYYGYLIRAGSY